VFRCAVEIAIGVEHRAAVRVRAVPTAEVVEIDDAAQLAAIGQLEYPAVIMVLCPRNWTAVVSRRVRGNIFGVSQNGGAYNDGAVFELTPSASGWTERVIYSFTDGLDGVAPSGQLAIDSLGNLYGIANGGQFRVGVVFELGPSQSGWTETTLFSFGSSPAIGVYPVGGLILDASDNLYGNTTYNYQGNGPGSVFELSPSGGRWSCHAIYQVPGDGEGAGEFAPPAMDSAGNLYGTTTGFVPDGGSYGTVYELTPSGQSWVYTQLHQFNLTDGEAPNRASRLT